jgi:hypothetical protein
VQAPVILSVSYEADRSSDGSDEPKQHVDQIDPHGILHSLDSSIHLSFLFDIHVSEQAKDSHPENEQDGVPAEEDHARERGDYEWKDGINQSRDGTEDADCGRKALVSSN